MTSRPRAPMKIRLGSLPLVVGFDDNHSLADIVAWIMETPEDAKELYDRLGEALADPPVLDPLLVAVLQRPRNADAVVGRLQAQLSETVEALRLCRMIFLGLTYITTPVAMIDQALSKVEEGNGI